MPELTSDMAHGSLGTRGASVSKVQSSKNDSVSARRHRMYPHPRGAYGGTVITLGVVSFALIALAVVVMAAIEVL